MPIRSDSTQTHPNPTHLTNARHVYFPMTGFGVSKFIAGIVVFFVSAVLHEVLVGVPLHMIRGWAFWGLMLQIPLIWLTEMLKRYFKQDRVGNAIFWIRYGGSHTTSSPPRARHAPRTTTRSLTAPFARQLLLPGPAHRRDFVLPRLPKIAGDGIVFM